MKNTHEGVLLLVKLQAFSLVCDFTKSNTPPWVFFVFFKSYKWHQIAQRNIYTYQSNHEFRMQSKKSLQEQMKQSRATLLIMLN